MTAGRFTGGGEKPVRKIILGRGQLNEVYLPYLRDTRRYQIFFGGAASGKSVFLATRAVLSALSGRNVLVVRKVRRTIGASCWNEVLKSASRIGLLSQFSVGKTDGTLTAKNGAQIVFVGLDDAEKIKSITPARGVFEDIWIEEATEIEREEFKQLDKRLRGQSAFEKRIVLSFNPVWKTHWIYREFFSGWDETKTVYESDSLLIVKTTFRDNRFLTQSDRNALLSEKDDYFRRVYTDGEWGVMGDAIFTNWRTEEVDENAPGETRMGLDFGFSYDPCGFVKARYDRKNRRVTVLSEVCRRGLTNLELAQILLPIAGGGLIVCDSAEPKSIMELRAAGLRVAPARKGPDSVLHGVQWLRGQEIVLGAACPALKEELTLYCWDKDKDGNPLPRPCDRDNHLIDALRYALENDAQARYVRTGEL